MVFMATSLPGPHSGLRYLLSSRRLSFGGEDASIQTAGCPWALVLLAHKKKKKKAMLINGPYFREGLQDCLFLLTAPVCPNHRLRALHLLYDMCLSQ